MDGNFAVTSAKSVGFIMYSADNNTIINDIVITGNIT